MTNIDIQAFISEMANQLNKITSNDAIEKLIELFANAFIVLPGEIIGENKTYINFKPGTSKETIIKIIGYIALCDNLKLKVQIIKLNLKNQTVIAITYYDITKTPICEFFKNIEIDNALLSEIKSNKKAILDYLALID